MTQKELYERRRAISREANERDIALCKAYAYANNSVKIGDVVSDGCTTIRVQRMVINLSFLDVSMYYLGPELTKAGVPRKDGREGCVYQSRMIKK